MSDWVCGPCGLTVSSVFHHCRVQRCCVVHPEAEVSVSIHKRIPKSQRRQRVQDEDRNPGSGLE